METNRDDVLDSAKDYPWHEECWNYFVKARESNHLPHAILLSGENGIGKQVLAKEMVKSLLCMQPEVFKACNKCQSCKTYESGANPDYSEISLLEDKQQISVDQIRDLSQFLNYSRSFNTYRVVLLNPVERMNLNAANSLLKSLEEPAANTVIILITSQLSDVLATIKSRCQLLTLRTPSIKQSLSWLEKQSPTIDSLELALHMATGKPLQAINIQQEEIENRETLATDLLAVINETKSVTETAKKWEKYNSEVLLNWQISWLQSLIKISECGQSITSNKSIIGSDEFIKIQNELNNSIQIDQKWSLYQQLIKQKRYIHTSVNTLMFIENMIMLWLKAKQTEL